MEGPGVGGQRLVASASDLLSAHPMNLWNKDTELNANEMMLRREIVMGLGKHGTPLTTIAWQNPRERWAVQREARLALGLMEEVILPRKEAYAMGLLTREKFISMKDRVLRLRPAVAKLLEDERQLGEDSIGPAIQRLWDQKVLPRNFATQQCQDKAVRDGSAWISGQTEDQRQQAEVREQNAAVVERNRRNARELLRGRRR